MPKVNWKKIAEGGRYHHKYDGVKYVGDPEKYKKLDQSFDQIVEILLDQTRAILHNHGISDKDQSDDSIESIATQIEALIGSIKASVEPSAKDAFILGTLSERLNSYLWSDGSRKAGGKASGESRSVELQDRDNRIAQNAKVLIDEGKGFDCVSILSKRHGLSTRQIRNILKKTEMN